MSLYFGEQHTAYLRKRPKGNDDAEKAMLNQTTPAELRYRDTANLSSSLKPASQPQPHKPKLPSRQHVPFPPKAELKNETELNQKHNTHTRPSCPFKKKKNARSCSFKLNPLKAPTNPPRQTLDKQTSSPHLRTITTTTATTTTTVTTGCRCRRGLRPRRHAVTTTAASCCGGFHDRALCGGQGSGGRRLGGDLLRGGLGGRGGRLLDEGAELGENAAAVLAGDLGLGLEVRLLGGQLKTRPDQTKSATAFNDGSTA